MTEPPRIGDGPIDAEHVEWMNRIGNLLDGALNVEGKPKTTGFILMLFPFDDNAGRCNYMSNADRADVIVLLKEQLARFEGMPEAKGTA